ncbi:MAG TPA: hypothetical protein VH395_14730 [Jatrophihabitantaceae bacterium]
MTDPATLRAEADRLRKNAKTMRQQAGQLDDGLGDVQRHYPAGANSVWTGPNADTFYTELSTAKSQLSGIASDVDDYASACERKATSLDHQATALERELREKAEKARQAAQHKH